MPYYPKKLFPQNGSYPFNHTFKIVVISEGYTAAQENQFYKDATNLWFKLKKCYPISLGTKSFLSFYALFRPSNNAGFASGQPASVGYNLYETYYDSTGSCLKMNNQLLTNMIDDCIIREGGSDYALPDHIAKGEPGISTTGLLPFVLLPTSGNMNAELEITDSNAYYSAGSSMDGYFEQVVARAVCKLIGLADEFELPGAQYAVPDKDTAIALNRAPNLIHIDTTAATINPSTTNDFKWRVFFPFSSLQNLVLHPHPGAAATADRSIPPVPFKYGKVELWEGGGGYRSKMYRSAPDCLLRRRIGDTSLPVKQKKLNCCPVCSKVIEKYMG